MKKPILVVMAAGMGSRYGGLKQMDPVGPSGEVIIDYSIFDAKRAGFETVVFIIKKEIEEAFKEKIGDHIAKYMNVRYAYQEINNIPAGFNPPAERTKPWGTGHAILSAKEVIDAPFAVINADDYYGAEPYQLIYDYLLNHCQEVAKPYPFVMVGYALKNTVSENGSVARGICEADAQGYLKTITERTQIESTASGIRFTEDKGQTWTPLADDTLVSMNLWGFPQEFLEGAEENFPAFLEKTLAANPLKGEYFLPDIVRTYLNNNEAQVKVLACQDKWFGVTYPADKPVVVNSIAEKIAQGIYPEKLWD